MNYLASQVIHQFDTLKVGFTEIERLEALQCLINYFGTEYEETVEEFQEDEDD